MERILLILSLIYNFTIGFFSFLIYLCISFFMINYKCYIELAVTIVFIILLVPFNILVKRRVKINIILYILLNVVIYILGYMCYILVVRL